jgi:serine/threonine-protein kinase
MPETSPSDKNSDTLALAVDSHTILGNRYRLDELIARGGMGEIWRATDSVLGRRVAVKMLRRDVAGQAALRERFESEARNLALIAHPSIATVHDFGEHDGLAYLVMEFVVGESLATRLFREGAMSSEQVVGIIDEVANGLAVVHDAGVVHRDVTPANIMITEQGRAKLTDFGISRLAESPSHTATGNVLGTPQYMSPEQLRGEPVTPASDVYSLGIVAYEMLTGHPPFSGDTPIVVALAQLHDLPPPLPESVPASIADLVGRCLNKAPVDRPPDGRELVRELGGRSSAGTSQRLDGSAASTVAFEAQPAVAPTIAMGAAATRAMTTTSDPATGSPDASLVGPLRRHRTKRLVSIAAVIAAAVALVVAVALTTGGDGDQLAQDLTSVVPGNVTDAAPTTAPSPATTAVAVVAPVATVAPTPTAVIDPAAFIGRNRGQVADELRTLGYVVVEQRVEVDADVERNTVVAVAPSGEVPLGSTIELQVADPRKEKKEDD